MKHLINTLVLSGSLAALAPLAHATTISIGLQQAGVNNGNIQTVATDSGSGYATFAGGYGTVFTFNSITGTGAPIMAQGTLDTTSVQVSSNALATTSITVYITEQGLTSPYGAANFLSSFTSNAFGGSAFSVAESTLFSGSNALFDGTVMKNRTFTTIDSSNILSTLETVGGTYSETAKYVITVNAGSSNVNDTINITANSAATPEPSSLVLLGTGVLGAAGMLRRRFTGKSNA